MGSFDILHIGTTGLLSSQAGVHVTGQNISNINTPGFTRRRLNLEQSTLVRLGRLFLGGGVRATNIQRIVDSSLIGRARIAHSDAEGAAVRSNILARAEPLFQDLDGTGMTTALDEFFGAIDALASAPQDGMARTDLLEKATTLAQTVGYTATELRSLQRNLNESIQGEVQNINAIASELAELNDVIQEGRQSPDDLDRRDQLLNDLAGIVSINVIEHPDGTVDVHLPQGFGLVLDNSARQLAITAGPGGLYRIEGNEGGVLRDLTDRFGGGALGGAIEARNDLQTVRDALDQFAFEFANAFNAQHAAGFDLNGNPGADFFVPPAAVTDAAALLDVDPTLAGDADLIAAAEDPLLVPGDNRNLLALGDLQNVNLPSGTNPGESLRVLLNDFGDRARAANRAAVTTETTAAKFEELNQSVSGVSLDEEMVALIKYRQAFNAASQVIRTADQLLEMAMTIKR